MKALKYLTYVGKLAGFVSALNVIPFVDPAVGVLVFAAASLLKDTVNRIGDLVDDGLPNKSFEGCAVLCHPDAWNLLSVGRSLKERLDWNGGRGNGGWHTPLAYAQKLRPRHHAKKNPLLGTLAINQKINPKGLVFTDSSP